MNPLEQEVVNVKMDVTRLETKLDNHGTLLAGIQDSLDKQTQILQSFLVLEQKVTTQTNDFQDLKQDYNKSKTEVVRAIGMMRGVVLAGMLFISAIMGLGLYIYSDKINTLNKHTQQIEQLQQKQQQQ